MGLAVSHRPTPRSDGQRYRGSGTGTWMTAACGPNVACPGSLKRVTTPCDAGWLRVRFQWPGRRAAGGAVRAVWPQKRPAVVDSVMAAGNHMCGGGEFGVPRRHPLPMYYCSVWEDQHRFSRQG